MALARCPHWALHDPDAVGSKDGIKGSGEVGVAVAHEQPDRECLFGGVHREVASLLGDPAGDRLGGHAGDPHETRVVDHEDPGLGVDARSEVPGGVEGFVGERLEMRALGSELGRHDGSAAFDDPAELRLVSDGDVLVQFRDASHMGDGDQVVAPEPADVAFDAALFVLTVLAGAAGEAS